MTGQRVSATKTPVTETALLGALRKAWSDQLGTEPAHNSIALLVAQVMLETGGASCIAYNVGNIKGAPSWGGDWTYFTTWEAVSKAQADLMVKAHTDTCHVVPTTMANGQTKVVLTPDHPGCCFRAYSSLDEGVADYFKVLRRHFSQVWPFVESGEPFGFCQALHDHGYYTAPVVSYTAGVCRLFDPISQPQVASQADYDEALTEWEHNMDSPIRRVGCATINDFQAASGLTADGVVGPMTRCKLRPFLVAARGQQ